jgi:glutaredoxin 3
MSAPVTMYTTPWCPYCVAARNLLSALGARYEDIDVSGQPQLRAEMERRSGRHTVPQIWIGSRHVGGFDDIDALHRRGLLQPLLDEASRNAQDGNG